MTLTGVADPGRPPERATLLTWVSWRTLSPVTPVADWATDVAWAPAGPVATGPGVPFAVAPAGSGAPAAR